MPTLQYEQEEHQVGCIKDANLRKASLEEGFNPYNGVNNLNNCTGVGQCGTCMMKIVEGLENLYPLSSVVKVYLANRPANFLLSCRASVFGVVMARTPPQIVWPGS